MKKEVRPKKSPHEPTREELLLEMECLRVRAEEAEEVLASLKRGEIDAFVVGTAGKEQVFTLQGAEHSYRVMVEQMREGAVTLRPDGTILYSNQAFASMAGAPIDAVVNSRFVDYVRADHREAFSMFFEHASSTAVGHLEIALETRTAGRVPVFISASHVQLGTTLFISLVITDLSALAVAEEMKRLNGQLETTASELQQLNAELIDTNTALESERARYRELFDFAPDGYITTDENGRIEEANEAAENLLRTPHASLIGKRLCEFVSPESRSDFHRRLEHLKEGEGEHIWEAPFCTESGDPLFHGMLTVATVADPQGKVRGVRWMVRDITERKAAEEELKRTADALARSNKDLERFASIAAHDLQSPLRTVGSFAQILAKRYKGKLDANAEEYIDFIVGGAARMSELVSGVLDYSRVSSQGKTFAQTDCEVVLTQALDALRQTIADFAAEVTHDPLPTVLGDRSQLVQLFQNLIGNGIKFRAEGVTPKIHIGASELDRDWILSVRDNGIGIEPQYHDKIFAMFSRLHGPQEFAGTGIGLAVCKRIVERHGGCIWVESKPGGGSTFFFTIPKVR